MRVLAISDLSCVGQCSLSVALPVLSAVGAEVCVLPTCVLSTHSVGFGKFAKTDLYEEDRLIIAHWKTQNIKFDGIYVGYLGSEKAVETVEDVMNGCLNDGAFCVVDPAMADGGEYYPGLDDKYAARLLRLCRQADVVVPNYTEACLLSKREFADNANRTRVQSTLDALCKAVGKPCVVTGIRIGDKMCVALPDGTWIEKTYVSRICHGAGDVFASALVAAMAKGKQLGRAAEVAADFTEACIAATPSDHWYGLNFESQLVALATAVSK